MDRVLVCICSGLFASAAFADVKTIDIWLSTNVDVSSFPEPGNVVLPLGYSGPVFLYARTQGSRQTDDTTYVDEHGVTQPWSYTDWTGDVWNQISLHAVTSIGFAGAMDNLTANGVPRWDMQSDLGWATGNQFNLSTVLDRGAGGAGPPRPPGTPGNSAFDMFQACTAAPVPGNSGYLYTRLGYATIYSAAPGNLYLEIGTAGVARRNGNWAEDLIQLGTGDAPVPGSQIGAISSVPDLRVMPEPGGLLMIAVAGLLLRRR